MAIHHHIRHGMIAAGAMLIAVLPVESRAESANAVTVTYADLNLTTDAGREALQRRIKAAATASCGPQTTTGIRLNAAHRACVKTAIENGTRQVEAAIAAAQRKNSVAASEAPATERP
jgi:UrcA family protein